MALRRGDGPGWRRHLDDRQCSYDPDLNVRYWGTGNPYHSLYGGDRLGDNLYTASLVALDARTGKPLWHYPTGFALWGAGATTFMLDGRQYVLIPSGTTLVALALPAT